MGLYLLQFNIIWLSIKIKRRFGLNNYPMKILYDHQMFLEQKYGGISKYFCELIKNIPANTDYELSVLFSNNQHLKDERGFFKKFHFPLPAKNFKGKG